MLMVFSLLGWLGSCLEGLILGALVHDVDAITSTVSNGKTKSEGYDDDGDDPQNMEAQDQGDGEHAHHYCIWPLLLAEQPAEPVVQSGLQW
jgi:hypothetical protein